MSIIRTKKSSHTPYVLLDTTAMNDPRLSFRAKGLHAYLMSKPDGWQVHIKHLEHVSKEGRDAISVALTELAQGGYVHRERVRGEDGRLAGWQTTIYETPQPSPDEPGQHGSALARQMTPPSPTTDFPTSVSPSSVLPNSVNPHLVSIDSREKAWNEHSPLTPMNGGQNALEAETRGTIAENIGEHNPARRDDRAPAHDMQAETTAALPKNSRAHGTAPRQIAAREQESALQQTQATRTGCPACDTYGFVRLLRPDGLPTNLRCTHDQASIEAYVARNGLTWPHAPPGTPTPSPEGATHAPWTPHQPDGLSHAGGAPDPHGLAADAGDPGGAGPARPADPPGGGRPADQPGGRAGRDQSPVCLQVGPALSGAGPPGAGGPAPPPPRPTAGSESEGDDAGREWRAKSPRLEPIVASVQSGATKGRLPSAPAVDHGATEGGPAP